MGVKKSSTPPLERLIPVGATLWSQQAPKAQPKAPPTPPPHLAPERLLRPGGAPGRALQAAAWQQKPDETFVNMPTSSPNSPAAPSLTPSRAAVYGPLRAGSGYSR